MIYHITTPADWEAQRPGGWFAAASLATEGFIHCSSEEQLVATANRLFAGRTDLVVLCIEPGRVEAEIRYENLEGGPDLFPHVYGAVPASAVQAVHPLLPDADGRFTGSILAQRQRDR